MGSHGSQSLHGQRRSKGNIYWMILYGKGTLISLHAVDMWYDFIGKNVDNSVHADSVVLWPDKNAAIYC